MWQAIFNYGIAKFVFWSLLPGFIFASSWFLIKLFLLSVAVARKDKMVIKNPDDLIFFYAALFWFMGIAFTKFVWLQSSMTLGFGIATPIVLIFSLSFFKSTYSKIRKKIDEKEREKRAREEKEEEEREKKEREKKTSGWREIKINKYCDVLFYASPDEDGDDETKKENENE